jgi:hypothetical protein
MKKRLIDVGGSGDAAVAERIRLRRAASGTEVLKYREELAELKPGTSEYRRVLRLLGQARSEARLGNTYLTVRERGGFAG